MANSESRLAAPLVIGVLTAVAQVTALLLFGTRDYAGPLPVSYRVLLAVLHFPLVDLMWLLPRTIEGNPWGGLIGIGAILGDAVIWGFAASQVAKWSFRRQVAKEGP